VRAALAPEPFKRNSSHADTDSARPVFGYVGYRCRRSLEAKASDLVAHEVGRKVCVLHGHGHRGMAEELLQGEDVPT
jgi:hypothetical protein